MAKSVEKRYEEMVEEYGQFREQFGKILEAVSAVQAVGVDGDVHGALERLEDVVKRVRTGGVVGAGAKGHREAREKWLEAQQPQSQASPAEQAPS